VRRTGIRREARRLLSMMGRVETDRGLLYRILFLLALLFVVSIDGNGFKILEYKVSQGGDGSIGCTG
jgi:hypothetical protein